MSVNLKIVSAVEAVCSALEQDIFSLKFAPGEQITEGELSVRYGVSRNTIREAISFLINRGLLEKERNRRILVKKINFDDVQEIFSIRELFECEAVRRLSLLGAIPDELFHALETVEQQDIHSDWEKYVSADIKFHQALICSAGSPRLTNLYETIVYEVSLCIYQSRNIMDAQKENQYDHRHIIEIIQNKDTSSAIDWVHRHMQYAVENFKVGFENKNKPL